MRSFIKRNKIFSFLFFFTIVSFLLGVFFYANLDQDSRGVVSSNIYQYYHSSYSFFSAFQENLLYLIFIWIGGISVVGGFIVVFLFFYQVFLFSFEGTALISTLGLSKIPVIILTLAPNLLLLIFLFLLCFYSICFSSYLFQFLFFKKQYSFSMILKRYFLMLCVSLCGITVSCLLDGLFMSIVSKNIF